MNQVLPLEEHVHIQNPDVSSSDTGHHPSVGATGTVCSSCMSCPSVVSVFRTVVGKGLSDSAAAAIR